MFEKKVPSNPNSMTPNGRLNVTKNTSKILQISLIENSVIFG